MPKKKGTGGRKRRHGEDDHENDDGGVHGSNSTANDLPEWTSDHHLVGSSVTRSLYMLPPPQPGADDTSSLPNQQLRYYSRHTDVTTTVSSFQPQHQRKPALWRSLVTSNNDSTPSLSIALDSVAEDIQQQQQPTNNGTSSETAAAVSTLQSMAHNRYSSIVLDQVIRDYLPGIIMTAALEEVTAQYLKKRESNSSTAEGGGANNDKSKSSSGQNQQQHPALYYSKAPSTYLVPPVVSANKQQQQQQQQQKANVLFTPSMLAHRIKQGCAMAFSASPYSQMPTSLSAALTSNKQQHATRDRRSSSRILASSAANSHNDTNSNAATEVADRETLWKIVPGGKVASFLHQRLVSNETKATPETDEAAVVPSSGAQTTPNPEPTTSATTEPTTSTTAETAAVKGETMSADVNASNTKNKDDNDDNDPQNLSPATPITTACAPTAAIKEEQTMAPKKDDDETKNNAPPNGNSCKSTGDSTSSKEPVSNANIPPQTASSTIDIDGDEAMEDAAADEVTSKATMKNEGDITGKETVTADASGSKDTHESTTTNHEPPTGEDDNMMDEATQKAIAEAIEEEEEESRYKPDPPTDDDDDDEGEAAEEDSYAPGADTGEEEEEAEDEEDTTGGYVKEKLSVLKTELVEDEEGNESAGGSEDDDENEDSDDEDFDVITNNPYLQPTREALLEWLGRKTGKYLTNADLQQAFTDLVLFHPKKKKRKQPLSLGLPASDLVTPLDRLVWSNIMPSILGSHSQLVLQCIIDEEPPQVMKWETSYFARSQFTIKVRDNEVWDPEAEDQAAIAMVEYKERRAWDTQRFKGIHNGYTIWPSWLDAVDKWYAETYSGKQGGDDLVTAATETGSKEAAEVDNDMAVAQALAEQDAAATEPGRSSRRGTRRGGEGSGVFYGNQSNMTQKQLVDAILRFTSQNSYQTVSSLLATIPEESSDPIRRIRTALGRVLWKRNQLARLDVQTEWTDRDVFNKTVESSLLSIAAEGTDEGRDQQSNTEDKRLLDYIKSLHQTELGLRQLVLKHLTDLPAAVIAAAADERHGSMEALDASEFENGSAVEWQTSGHDFLSKRIFRPCVMSEMNGLPTCYWYTIQGYVPSIASETEDPSVAEKPSIGRAKECISVERRMRFQASLDPESREDVETGHVLVLTEAQVLAGLKAAQVEQRTSIPLSSDNPFSKEIGAQITLLSSNPSLSPTFVAAIAAHNTVVQEESYFVHKLLLLPGSDSPLKSAFWTTLGESKENGSLTCTVPEIDVSYKIQQSDYHADSPAFEECRAIITYLRRHPKAGAFLAPVDPVALGVPSYFQVIKNPMDISTVANKLENGEYSNIPSHQTSGRTPISRMLNGPFRRDIELIFNNAMLFNPPDDWIHQAAIVAKKAGLKKIEQASQKADGSANANARKRSLYVDYDSDVENYVYESDQDDEYVGERRGRKRKSSGRAATKDEMSFRAIEGTVRIQKSVTESMGLRGPFADLPVNTDPQSYSLPESWSCRPGNVQAAAPAPEADASQLDEELDELVALHKQTEAVEAANVRRSTRAAAIDLGPTAVDKVTDLSQFEYYSDCLDESSTSLLRSRADIELLFEIDHEQKYAVQYYSRMKDFVATNTDAPFGMFSDGSFPPYLGRLLPMSKIQPEANSVWEIRVPFIVPALRWVIRGLIKSNHLSEGEPLNPDSMHSGAILANNVYYLDPSLKPCEVLNSRDIQRRKRADQEAQEESEDDVELSEYEKLRAERVARNADRLKLLGLC